MRFHCRRVYGELTWSESWFRVMQSPRGSKTNDPGWVWKWVWTRRFFSERNGYTKWSTVLLWRVRRLP